jgi:transcriptional regulator with XRE-family HTH domain
MKSNLRKLREDAGITRADLVRQSGVSDTTISRAEKGRAPSPVTMSRIVRGFNQLVPEEEKIELWDAFPDAQPRS